jgi:hypothetical protein
LILDRSAGKESLPFLPPSRLFVFFMVLVARPDQQPDSSARRRESTAAKRALELGKHNDEVFNELGFDLNEIERLSTSGVIPKPAAPAKAA